MFRDFVWSWQCHHNLGTCLSKSPHDCFGWGLLQNHVIPIIRREPKHFCWEYKDMRLSFMIWLFCSDGENLLIHVTWFCKQLVSNNPGVWRMHPAVDLSCHVIKRHRRPSQFEGPLEGSLCFESFIQHIFKNELSVSYHLHPPIISTYFSYVFQHFDKSVSHTFNCILMPWPQGGNL